MSIVPARTLLLAAAVALALPHAASAWCVGGAPPALDADDDGLNDIQEEFFGTDPTNPDSDADGVPDNLEDADGDGRVNQDEPTIFSLEVFRDPFSRSRRRPIGIVLEGTNLFDVLRRLRRLAIEFPDAGRDFEVVSNQRFNSTVRVYVRVSQEIRDALFGRIRLRRSDKLTNEFLFEPMECGPRELHLMAAAVLHLETRLDDARFAYDYVAIGGCNLLDRTGRRARTRVRTPQGTFRVDVPYGGIGTVPSRVMIPLRSRAVSDATTDRPAGVDVGDLVSVTNSLGTSNAIVVQPVLAQIRVPVRNLDHDHDEDGLTTAQEIRLGTDPLIWDTDGDGLSDGRDVRLGFDPRDSDSDDDGVTDRKQWRRQRRAARVAAAASFVPMP